MQKRESTRACSVDLRAEGRVSVLLKIPLSGNPILRFQTTEPSSAFWVGESRLDRFSTCQECRMSLYG